MKTEDKLQKLIGRSIYCMFSNYGCTLYKGKIYNGAEGVVFDRKVSITYSNKDKIITDITPELIDDDSYNFNLHSIDIENRVYQENIDRGYHVHSLNSPASRLIIRPALEIKKIEVMGYNVSKIGNPKGIINSNYKTTQNILLLIGSDKDSKILLMPTEHLAIYVTNDISEINTTIKTRELITEFSIE